MCNKPYSHWYLGIVSLVLWACPAQAEHYTLPLFVTSTTAEAPTGVVRILNATDETGSVAIYAIDDAGTRSGPVTFTLNASAAAQFSASDLVSGNAAKGLTGGVGSLKDNVRLEIDTDLQIVPAAYVRAADGTLGAMHDTVRGSTAAGGGFEYLVPIFNPSTETTHASSLRLINPGDEAASVTIQGRDDTGTAASGGAVQLTLAGGATMTLTAQQLEAGGAGLTGRLGTGTGTWRLSVSSDRRLQVLNVVSSTSDSMNNLSTTAVAGKAPQDHEAFNERFAETGIEYRSDRGDFTFTAQAEDRFAETGESDGVAVSYSGSYAYEAIGPDAGQVTVSYDDGDECAANLYFATPGSGWFASFCTGTDDPDGYRVGGDWSVVQDDYRDDDGGEPVTTTYGVDEALPGVPTSGFFSPAVLSGGSVSSTANGSSIALNNGGYFELNDGTRYTCMSADGCAIMNGTVTRGSISGTAAGTGEVDRFPTFRNATAPGNRTYTVGTAIDTLTLPQATSGNGTLTYSLTPNVPGLSFNVSSRQLTGTPSTAGTYSMTYAVTDEDGDSDTLGFTITVNEGTTQAGSLGVCQVGMMLSSGQSCTYPGTAEEFSVNVRGRGRFLSFLAGIRIRINNTTINGRVYDFEASHQGDGVWRIDRIAGSTEPTTGGGGDGGGGTVTDNSPSFATGSGPGDQTYTVDTAIDTLTLPAASGGDGTLTYSLSPNVPGLSFNATARQLTGTPSATGTHSMTYTATDADGDTDTLVFTITVENSQQNAIIFEAQDTLPGLPTSGTFVPATLVGGQAESSGDNTTIALDSLGYLELENGSRYTCASVNGCTVENGAVTRGTLVSSPAGSVPDSDPVTIPDPVLRAAIMDSLSKAPGAPIYKIEMQSLKRFDPGFLDGIGGIRNLEGIQYATSLEELRLVSNTVRSVTSTPSLSPLGSLTRLTRLDLHGFNNIENPTPLDVAPLAGLTNLSWVGLDYNHIRDISALAGLVNLDWLTISTNRVSDISALSAMPELAHFDGQDNAIVSVDALRQATGLRTVLLADNQISDLGPLAANPGLANGHLVDVRNNPLSTVSIETHVPDLRARGVHVRFSEVVQFDNPGIYNDNLFVIPVNERMEQINAHLNAYVNRTVEHFGDVFDFVIFVPNRNSRGAYFLIRQNTVTGIGRDIRITGRKLQGVINMGGTSILTSDLADRGVSIIRAGPLLHEIMHRWGNYIVPSGYGSHWGFSSANGALGGFDIANLVEHGGGRYSAGGLSVAGSAANSIPYSPIELYLAGFIPPDDVPDLWVAEDGDFLRDDEGVQVRDEHGNRMFSASRVSTHTIRRIIAEHGARAPDSRNSQREFRALVVLLVNEENPATRELLDVLSRDIAWFGHRGDDELPWIFNFHEATGGRATMTLDGLDDLAADASRNAVSKLHPGESR